MSRFRYGTGQKQPMQLMGKLLLLFQSKLVVQNLAMWKFIKLELLMEQSSEKKIWYK